MKLIKRPMDAAAAVFMTTWLIGNAAALATLLWSFYPLITGDINAALQLAGAAFYGFIAINTVWSIGAIEFNRRTKNGD